MQKVDGRPKTTMRYDNRTYILFPEIAKGIGSGSESSLCSVSVTWFFDGNNQLRRIALLVYR